MTGNTRSQEPTYNDDVSLIDLAMVLVKKKITFLIALACFAILTVSYVILKPQTYRYTTLYSIAEYMTSSGTREGLESPTAIITKIHNAYLAPETRLLLETHNLDELPFELKASNPNETLLVMLSSQAYESSAPLVTELHQNIINKLETHQADLVKQRRNSLQSQLSTAKKAVDNIKQLPNSSNAELAARLLDRISTLEGQLHELKDGEVSQYAVQSFSPTSPSRPIILALGFILATIVAIAAAVIHQFIDLVRAHLRNA